jgi:phosphohistidine phosphatase
MNVRWRELVLFRHGTAAPARLPGGDFERPLTAAGRQLVARSAAHLAAEPMPPTLLLFSLAPRAAATAALLAEALALPAPALLPLEALYLATPQHIVALLAEHGGDTPCIAVVGHNPGLSELGARYDARLRDAVLDAGDYWRIRRTGPLPGDLA